MSKKKRILQFSTNNFLIDFVYVIHMRSIQLERFLKKFGRFFDVKVIGKSVLGKNIYSVSKTVDEKLPWVFVVGGMHAREHLSCDFVCKLMKKCARKRLNFNLCFVPFINPDGADLCIEGIKNLPEDVQEKLLKINGSEDFSLFKANANGVDLNNNWDANWQQQFTDKTAPSSQGFYGFKPMSEPETIALAALTQKLKPALAISFHLKGEEIYFDFFQDKKRFVRDEKIAQIFARSTGYKIKFTQEKSSGGFKDWCVQKLRIAALTIELGADKFSHPFPKNQLGQICWKNRKFFKNVEKSLKVVENFN